MKTHRIIAALLAILLGAPAASNEIIIAVIGNPASPIKYLTPSQVMSLYTGRQDSAFGDFPAIPLDQPNGSDLRRDFYLSVTGQSETQINAFWARLAFSGRALPPRQMNDGAATVKRVASDVHAIGYVTQDMVTKQVIVLCDIKINK